MIVGLLAGWFARKVQSIKWGMGRGFWPWAAFRFHRAGLGCIEGPAALCGDHGAWLYRRRHHRLLDAKDGHARRFEKGRTVKRLRIVAFA